MFQKNIVNELKKGEDYQRIQKIISINLLDFNLDFGDEGKPHSCFKLIYIKKQLCAYYKVYRKIEFVRDGKSSRYKASIWL